MNRMQTVWSIAGVLLLSLLIWGSAPWVSAAEDFAELSAAIRAANGAGSSSVTLRRGHCPLRAAAAAHGQGDD